MLRYSLIRLLLMRYFTIFDKTNYNIVNKQIFYLILLCYFFIANNSHAQDSIKSDASKSVSKLFKDQEILSLKLNYSNKDINKNTNDSTYIQSDLLYQQSNGTWKTLGVKMRARGNFRRKFCYFPPIKIKIKKSVSNGTLFDKNKKLKLVLPCLKQKSMNDDVVKEYMAYKLYEIISPFHFKTRLANIEFTEIRGKKIIDHKLKGILIEDIKKVADRYSGNVLKRKFHPLVQDEICSVQNSFFQFMIANTDFSTAYQHNEKLFYIDKKIIPMPYDFDMSGLVNASYAVVSEIQNEQLPISKVTERMYRGFKRDEKIFYQVRKEFLYNKAQIFETIDSFETEFENPKEFTTAKSFIAKFFDIIESDYKFKNRMLSTARTK